MIVITHTVQETEELARKIASEIKGGEVLLLNGTLGAGKTTFTKGFAKALGVNKTVVSPTFTIIKEYEGTSLTLYHIDMYRIEEEDELYELGIEELYRSDSVTVIEWNKMEVLPEKVITLNVEVLGETTRQWEILGL